MNARAPSGAFARTSRLDADWARRVCADLAVLTTIAAVLVLFAVSEVTLDYFGVRYIDPGGNPLSKFHPATFLAVAALGLRCLASPYPIRSGWCILGKNPGATILLAAAAVAMVSAIFIQKSPVTGLIDTFVLPVLFLMLLRDLDPLIVRWIALLIAGLLCINAVMAIAEFLRGAHFITLEVPQGATSDPTRGDASFDWRVQLSQEWRAVALLGHPLVNGLMVGCFIICLAARGARWMPGTLTIPIVLLQLAAMFAFGARSSIVLSLVLATCLALQQAVIALRSGARLTPRAIGITLLAIAIAIGVVGIVASTGFFDRTIDRFASDAGSAKARFTMFELFQPLSWNDLLLDPDQGVVATWQRLQGLEFGIESAWVGLALAYGFIVTTIVLVGLAAFSCSMVNACGRGVVAVLVYYFISVSATASLSGKTTTLAMVAVMALIFLRKDERRRPLRSILGFGTD